MLSLGVLIFLIGSAVPALATPQWKLVWSDEFEGSDIDPAKWSHDVDCWGGGNNERQCYTADDSNSEVKDGLLVITARKEKISGPALPPHLRKTKRDWKKKASKPFSSARLTTKSKGDWRYGRVVVRARLPEGQGVWPAIWMLPTDNVYGSWAASGEIDIMEAVNLGTMCKSCSAGRENRILGTLHYGGIWPGNRHSGSDVELPQTEDGFHVFAIEWSEGEVSWFVDGQKYATQTSQDWSSDNPLGRANKHAPFDQKFHLILNLAIGGGLPEGRNEKGVSERNFPKKMLVDWVRVYSCLTDQETGKACTQ